MSDEEYYDEPADDDEYGSDEHEREPEEEKEEEEDQDEDEEEEGEDEVEPEDETEHEGSGGHDDEYPKPADDYGYDDVEHETSDHETHDDSAHEGGEQEEVTDFIFLNDQNCLCTKGSIAGFGGGSFGDIVAGIGSIAGASG
ncbi:unnamed protein product, partial [Anisakis simplex]|uniref:Uncharacterized protein n=1 Tax=Anisakis simplex TaxID=6269 RepID=A0A0M3KJY8_ANISI